MEGLHQFRLELKKIIAFIHFTEYAKGKKSVKEPCSKITSWMRYAGELRDAGNYEKLAKEFKFPKGLPGKMARKKHLKKSTGALYSLYTHPHSLNTVAEQLSKQANELNERGLKNFLKELMENISKSAQKHLPQDELHDQRKEMKDALYLFKLYTKKRGTEKAEHLLKKLDECQNVIGEWHDITKFKKRIKNLKTPALHRKMTAVKEEDKRLLIEIYRILKIIPARF